MTRLVKIGTCFSGVLSKRTSKFRNILLATPRAINRFSQRPVLEQAGMVKEDFVNSRKQVFVGLHLTEPLDMEKSIYEAGKRTLISMARGIHRRIILKHMGLIADCEIDLLPPNHYAALLAEIETRHEDPTMATIEAIRVADIEFHSIEQGEAGKILTFSRSMLEQAQLWAHLIEL